MGRSEGGASGPTSLSLAFVKAISLVSQRFVSFPWAAREDTVGISARGQAPRRAKGAEAAAARARECSRVRR